MATDLIISYRQEKSLCIQLTTQADKYIDDKFNKWKTTLQEWGINGGLFVSYKPGIDNLLVQLTNIALYNSNRLPDGEYIKIILE